MKMNAIMPLSKWGALLFLIGIVLSSGHSEAQVTREQLYRKRFAYNSNSVVDISNKYGNVHLKTWDKDSVAFFASVRVTESTFSKADNKLKEIYFDFSQSGNFIISSTVFQNEKRNAFVSELSKFKENIGINDAAVEIEMEVFVPVRSSVQITNKFGNVHVDDFDGDLKLDLSNGKLKANQLLGYSNLKMSFADANIDYIESGRLEVYYGKLNLTNSPQLRISSKTSDLDITNVDRLVVTSSRDTYRIRSVSSFEAQASFSDFELSELKDRCSANLSFGDIKINRISNTYSMVSVDTKSVNIELNFSGQPSFAFDIVSNRQINLPTDTKMDKVENLKGDDKLVRYLGRSGTARTEHVRLKLKTTGGNIHVYKR